VTTKKDIFEKKTKKNVFEKERRQIDSAALLHSDNVVDIDWPTSVYVILPVGGLSIIIQIQVPRLQRCRPNHRDGMALIENRYLNRHRRHERRLLR